MMNFMGTVESREQLSKDVIRMTFELTGRLRAHMDHTAGLLDLTPMQARALFVTAEPLPMGELADQLHCDASNITGIVDRLESRGLMERVTDDTDRRRRNLVVTNEGRAVTERLKAALREGNPVLGLDDSALGTFHGLLRRVLEAGRSSAGNCGPASSARSPEATA